MDLGIGAFDRRAERLAGGLDADSMVVTGRTEASSENLASGRGDDRLRRMPPLDAQEQVAACGGERCPIAFRFLRLHDTHLTNPSSAAVAKQDRDPTTACGRQPRP